MPETSTPEGRNLRHEAWVLIEQAAVQVGRKLRVSYAFSGLGDGWWYCAVGQ